MLLLFLCAINVVIVVAFAAAVVVVIVVVIINIIVVAFGSVTAARRISKVSDQLNLRCTRWLVVDR